MPIANTSTRNSEGGDGQQAPRQRGTAHENRAGRERALRGAAVWPQPTRLTYERKREPEVVMARGGGNEFEWRPWIPTVAKQGMHATTAMGHHFHI